MAWAGAPTGAVITSALCASWKRSGLPAASLKFVTARLSGVWSPGAAASALRNTRSTTGVEPVKPVAASRLTVIAPLSTAQLTPASAPACRQATAVATAGS
jgi:hypothetical protein